jgi:SAM-dependent methyltransferase
VASIPRWAEGVDYLDLQRPSVARVYDYYLGGSHNFAVDRELAAQVLALVPETPLIAAENRRFLRRAVRAMLGTGVRQFLDLGSGIPTAGNVHEIVQAYDPGGRVVYVDIDPVAVAHGQAILAGVPTAATIHGDLRDPGSLLSDPAVTRLIDLEQPVGVLMVAVLHLIPDEQDPAAAVAVFRDALAAGSQLAVSHLTRDGQPPEAIAAAQELYDRTPTPMIARSAAELRALLAGWEVLDPGVVHAPLWRPDANDLSAGDPTHVPFLCALATKPAP